TAARTASCSSKGSSSVDSTERSVATVRRDYSPCCLTEHSGNGTHFEHPPWSPTAGRGVSLGVGQAAKIPAIGGNSLPFTSVFGSRLQADVAALMAPCLARRLGVERHAGKPRPQLIVYLHLHRSDHPRRRLLLAALVEVLRVRGEVV